MGTWFPAPRGATRRLPSRIVQTLANAASPSTGSRSLARLSPRFSDTPGTGQGKSIFGRPLAAARAPEEQAGTDPRTVQRDTNRLVAFSDAVFAITITLLVLEIRPQADYGNLLHDLAALWPSYLAYAVTFLFIGQVWANHHVMFDHIRVADRVVLLLNTLLLMVVAFLPFATSVLAGAFRTGDGRRTAVVFYSIAFVLTALTFNAVWQYARRLRLLSDTLGSAGATAISRRFQLALAWLATGTVLGAVLPVLGLAVIVAFNAFYWLPIRGETPPANRGRPTPDERMGSASSKSDWSWTFPFSSSSR
jgi:TMEM175 potassium channel family protein